MYGLVRGEAAPSEYTISQMRSRSRSRSFSPDSSDFGNSPIKTSVMSDGKRGRSRTPSRSRSRSVSPSRAPNGFYLAVGNLTRNVNEAHLKEIFGFYGEILAVSYPMHPNTGYPGGKAVIEYSTGEALEKALKGMNGGQIDGNSIDCNVSKYPNPLVRVPRAREPRYNDRRREVGRGGRNVYNGPVRRNNHYAPPVRYRSRSPVRRRSISRSRSPVRRGRNYPSRSPIRRNSRPYARSPVRRYSRSPVRRYSRSPIRTSRPRSRSPYGHRPVSRAPLRRLSRSPARRLSRSPVRRYSRSPVRRYSKSPVRRRSPSNSRSPRYRTSPSRSPIPVSRMNY